MLTMNQLSVTNCLLQVDHCIPPLSFCSEGKPKQKAMGKAVKAPSLSWMEALPPPPPSRELEQCEQDDQPPEHEDMDIG